MLKILILLTVLLLTNISCADETFTFGVIPGLPPVTLEKRLGPLVNEISRLLQQDGMVKTRGSFQDYAEALANEEFDIALVDGFTFRDLISTTDYRGLVRRKSHFRGSLISFNPKFNSIEQLKGQAIAFPPREAAITRIAFKLLKDQGFSENDYIPQYHAEHASCIFAAANNSAAACATSLTLAQEFQGSHADEILVLEETPEYPHMVVVVGKKLHAQQRQLTELLLSLNQTTRGKMILEQAYLNEVGNIDVKDYEQLQHIALPD